MKILTRGQMVGAVIALVVAVAITLLGAERDWSWDLGLDFVGAGSDWKGWPLLSVVVLVAAWVNVVAWVGRIWWLAVICSLLTFPAPWGFIYPGILAGPILAIAAATAWARTKAAPKLSIPSRPA